MEHPVLLFDGVCNLCNGTVKFVIKRDPNHFFRFASLQSDFGQQTLSRLGLPLDNFDTFILIENNQYYSKSTAWLRVIKRLTGLWSTFYIFIIVPKFIRDGIYDFVAKNRYFAFGKVSACYIPTPELRSLFIDQ
jgi:predicted DCC family thiol-disulfide oxidoreductase YuxK